MFNDPFLSTLYAIDVFKQKMTNLSWGCSYDV